MAFFVFFVGVILATASATSPIINDTNLVPDAKPPVVKPPISVPRKCPENEVLKSRTSCPPDTCDSIYLSFLCVANQTETVMCTCKEGYLRTNSTGVCVPVDRCLPPECADDPNAKRGCGNRCKKTCADYNDTKKVCKNNVCKLFGCDCKDGFVYDENVQKCVKPSQCTKQCKKPHERYSTCPLGECIPKTCNDLGKPIPCPSIAAPCAGGCICEEGYVRNSNGDCIEKIKCPKQCKKPHERYSTCPLGECIPKTCNDLGKPIPCPSIAAPCAGGCICEEGYVRNSNGDCIEKIKCPSCGGDPNAQSGCGNPCGKTCDSRGINKSELFCPLYCNTNGCDCRPGFLLDTDANKCVPEKSCPKPSQCKKPNERYSDCLIGECVPKTCDDLGKPIACPAIAGPCAGGCICAKGFVRNSNGDCIDKLTCPSCGGDPNAQSGCGNPCGKTCDSRGINKSELICPQYCNTNGCDCRPGFLLDTDAKKCVLEKSCPKPPPQCSANEQFYCGPSCPEPSCKSSNPQRCVNKKCKLACFCKKGFVRNANSKCVAVEKCPKQCKKPNERYSNCLLGECVPKTCDDLGKPIACPAVAGPCAGGCICAEGFVRNSNGDCIDKLTCPSCGGDPNAQSGCGNPCGKTCDSRGVNKSELFCPQYCEVNGCDCRPGFLLDTNAKKCVPEKSCPKPSQCEGPNEVYSSCPAGQCGPKTCDNLINPAPCPRVIPPCPGGCICREGYLRDSNGICIEKNKCPQQCKKPNERYSDCLLGECVPKTCDDLGKPIACAAVAGPCAGGCICAEGFVRNSNGDCIDKFKCPSCGGDPNAQSGCSNPCGKTCASGAPNVAQIACPQYCKFNGCDCKKGFLLDTDSNKCVPENSCPKPQQCTNPNERYSSCLLGECIPKTCDDLGKPIACVTVSRLTSPCAGGCICVDGYVRNSNGTCIKKTQCPSCGGDPNAQSGCGNPCGKTCDSRGVNKSELICPQYCETNGCDCRPGFLLDTDAKKCVPEESCPKPLTQCGTNEQFFCGPSCPEPSCKSPNLQRCVNKKSNQCKKPNERYSNCLLGECVPKTCDDLGNTIACPAVADPCAGGCICAEGFVRNSNGDCIDKLTCPSCRGDPNAQSGCGNPCGKTCADHAPNAIQSPCLPFCVSNGCDCRPGYLLDTDARKCVPEKLCPQLQQCKNPNERYSSCVLGECIPKTCDDLGKPIACAAVRSPCTVGCLCVDGYVTNSNGTCIKKTESSQPQCKGPHEVYNSCPAGQCGPKTCDNLINPAPCPKIIPPCPGGCICEEGYLRDSNGICIEKNKCPQLACSSNQTYVSCSVNCPDKYCPENDQPQPVCDPPRNCSPGCTCKINYKLNKSGQCILASECPPINCTRQNEEYNSCPSDCSSDRCEDADTPPAACNTLLLNCQPKCVCKKNHYRNQDGLCVPAKDCPSVCKDPNAEWKDCKDACPATCQNTRPNCVSKACVAGCQCKDGYVLSKPGGECVKIDTCADYANCGANQTFVSCTFKCPQVMCPDSDQTILCKPPRDCPGGCGCKPNYRYNSDGECILGSDCPPVECTRPNEEWSPCRSEYDWERCDDRYNSPPIVGDDDATCNPRCTCIKGYFKNNAYECVPEKECPPIS